QQAVDGESVLAGQVAVAAAKGQAAHPGLRVDPRRHPQAEGVRGMVEIPDLAAAADLGGPGPGVHPDPAHGRQVDGQTAVRQAEPWAAVPAAQDGDLQAAVPTEVDRGDHVPGVDAAGDDRWALVDHRVVDGAGVVVLGIAWTNDVAS